MSRAELAARLRWQRADLEHRVARARLLLQVARPDAPLSNLISFAAALDVHTTADSLAAFQAAQREELEAATSELARLAARTGPTANFPGVRRASF